MQAGDTWNEAKVSTDPLTGRSVRRLTTCGRINQTPTYHTNSGFTSDGRYLAFASVRDGATWIIRAEVESGDLKALWRAPGIGDRNYIHRGMAAALPELDGGGVCGNRVCMAPNSELAVFTCERTIRAIDLVSAEERVLLEDCGEEWIFGAPAVDPEEQWLAIALSSAHPEVLAGKAITRDYCSYPDHKLRLIRVRLDGSGVIETLFECDGAGSAHCAFSPCDGNMLYFDLDKAPGYWGGGDGVTPRVWLLQVDTGEARPLVDTPGIFQVHTAWLWDGSALAYHGPRPGGGVYIGVTRPNGHTVWRGEYPEAKAYGHLTPDPVRPALILDGDFSTDKLQWLYYDRPDTAPPRLEPICIHGTEWDSGPFRHSQHSHPHPLADPAGRWVAFGAAASGRTDVFVVDISA